MKAQVIGAGLAGLSAAVALAKAGVAVQVSEAAAQAGGRCRSYFDPQLGAVIDNGNHLVMSGNFAVYDYLETIGWNKQPPAPELPANVVRQTQEKYEQALQLLTGPAVAAAPVTRP